MPAAGDEDALEAFAAASLDLVRGESIERALASLAAAVGRVAAARLVIARLLDAHGEALVARAVHAESAALAAELEGTRLPLSELGRDEAEFASAPGDRHAPAVLRRAAAKAGASTAVLVPVEVGGEIVASLELLRPAPPFSLRERALARVAAAQLATAVHAERAARAGTDGRPDLTQASLGLLGEALAAGADETEAAEQVVRLAAEFVGAAGASVWRLEAEAPPALLASHGLAGALPDTSAEAERVRSALAGQGADGDEARAGPVTLPLGDPPVAALQLFFADDMPGEEKLDRLAPFAARAAVSLRRTRRIGLLALALERSQTLVAVVSQVISQLSLAHTLETAVDRVAELTSSTRVAVYLREGGHLSAAAARGLAGSHTELAERLLELALGPFRSRGYLFIEDLRLDPRLSGLEPVLEESGVRRALFIPLVVHEDVIGALAVFRRRPRPYREGEEGLLIALSSQLAIAVQNARLHEETKKLGAELRRRLDAQRRIARELHGYSAIFQSFAESLSLEATLDAVAQTVVELFDLDGAAIRLRDQRGETLELRSLHVAEPKLRGPAEALLGRPQPLTDPLVQRVLRTRRPILLAPGADDGGTAGLLGPFLHQGSTAAVLPLVTPAEAFGTLTLLSLDPTRPLAQEGVDAAMTVTAQAALAIDNARLYQQQKDFAETMQRSLLPRALPDAPGLEVGHVYESAARVDVGGDVYDFLTLDDGRLAVVVGDVLGKGIAAAADMAMARFSFRALARSHPEPSEFLAEVNEVVVEEIEPAKFITLLYVLVDPVSGEVACASAGHPPLRVVRADGEVSPISAGGLALGIEPEQAYPAERLQLEPGSAVVLYTDGVVEARRNGELYGEERLDRLLADRRGQGAQELADAILADCEAFSGGELDDDCAVVVIKLAP